MDLAKPSDWRMAARSPCLVLGKSCRGGCVCGEGDGDRDEMERAFAKHLVPRRMAAAVVAISGRRSEGGDERMLRRVVIMFLLACGVLVCVLCDVPDVPLVMVGFWKDMEGCDGRKDGRMPRGRMMDNAIGCFLSFFWFNAFDDDERYTVQTVDENDGRRPQEESTAGLAGAAAGRCCQGRWQRRTAWRPHLAGEESADVVSQRHILRRFFVEAGNRRCR